MPDRRQRRTESRRIVPPRSDARVGRADPLTRIFTLASLDIDDLTEAIRMLLSGFDAEQGNAVGLRQSDLLSLPPRVTHVVEATDAP